MKKPNRKRISGLLTGAWRGLTTLRRITLNLLFVAILVALVTYALRDGKPKVPKSTALVIAPKGMIVEQLAGDALEQAKGKLTGNTRPETLGRDLMRTIRAAKDDERVKALLLNFNSMSGA